MTSLTLEQLNLLPVLKATGRIEEIHAIYIHEALPRRPPTIVTEKGHFRLPATLHSVAWRAARTVAGNAEPYEGPTAGILAEVLQGIASEDSEGVNAQTALQGDDSACDKANVQKALQGDNSDEANVREPLRMLAESMAQEALSELEGVLTQSVDRLYKERRSGLLVAALEVLVGR